MVDQTAVLLVIWVDVTVVRRRRPEAANSIKKIFFNTLIPRENGRHFVLRIFKLVFVNENGYIFI